MKFIPIGITTESEFREAMKPSDFSDSQYDGVQLRNDARKKTVLIMHSKKPAPMEWKVQYGFSSVFFDTLEEAVEFCEEHGMKLLKGDR